MLADFASSVPFRADGTSSPDLVQSVEPSTETTPNGARTFRYRAENRGKSTSAWCRASLALPGPIDLTGHRRLGLWVRAEGPGGILNVQLAGKDARRDHYITLDRPGWVYHVLDPPEDARFFDYRWPYSFTDVMYTCATLYSRVTHLNLYFNGLPAGSTATCCIGRIEALEERPLPLVCPILEVGGRSLEFPITLRPDEYLEMDGSGRCRHFDPDGAILGEVAPRGSLRLAPGDQTVRFRSASSDATSHRAEVTIALKGKPLPDARRRDAGRPGSPNSHNR